MIRLRLGKVQRGTSKKFGAFFLEVMFSLVCCVVKAGKVLRSSFVSCPLCSLGHVTALKSIAGKETREGCQFLFSERKRTSRTEGGDKVQGVVDARFAAGCLSQCLKSSRVCMLGPL